MLVLIYFIMNELLSHLNENGTIKVPTEHVQYNQSKNMSHITTKKIRRLINVLFFIP